jgi:inhibitor of cysteine peptidase
MRKLYVVIFLWLLISVLPAYAASAKAIVEPATVYTETKQAFIVTATQPEFVIKLKSNPTTGFSWFLRDYNANLIEPVKHEFEAPKDKKLMGAPGYELWTFRVKSSGFVVPQQTTIRFIYARPWEVDDSSTQLTFRVATASRK